ncbi:Hypothetical protein NTJ_11861 [Nesidiocoris tenuis]|uniref:EGF-like domain-containing protein n=1 Tax=Nesidiocoris tenuis TaxID=355587 RepID=A0ABN7B779_9HEMI|nr:Hypothetical protein NTJ_11861 [Nesidiocoris tenuis]
MMLQSIFGPQVDWTESDMQASLILAVACVFVAASESSYIDYDMMETPESEYYPSDRIYNVQSKREACVPRGGSCDHSASDCCPNTNCRCNLWGANCRCQRKGLFSKHG